MLITSTAIYFISTGHKGQFQTGSECEEAVGGVTEGVTGVLTGLFWALLSALKSERCSFLPLCSLIYSAHFLLLHCSTLQNCTDHSVANHLI